MFDPCCFLLEPLEPRCLLSAAIPQADTSSEDGPIISAPITLTDHPDPDLAGNCYRLRANAGTLYDLRLSSSDPHGELLIDARETYVNNGTPSQLIFRAPADGLYNLSLYVSTPGDYTLNITPLP